MRFSIATPTRNALQYLKKCVGSVRAQKGVEIEHIVQDACSTDGTVEWLSNQHDLLWKSQSDQGMYDAINHAWQRSSGDILSYLNTDEQYLPGTLATVEHVFQENDETDAIFGDYIICDADTGRPISARREIPLRRIYVVNGPLYAMSCTLFFRRTLLDRSLLRFDPAHKDVADADLVTRLLNQRIHFFHIPKYLSIFGATGKNMSTGDNASAEAKALRVKYGAARSKLIRSVIRFARWTEKLINGCYFPYPVEFRFCEDEFGTAKTIRSRPLTTAWHLK